MTRICTSVAPLSLSIETIRPLVIPRTMESSTNTTRLPSTAVEGKRVVLVDDSIVRGITSGRIVSMLKDNGATEVHMRVTSPPITHPCLYGIDTARRMELIAAEMSVDEIRDEIGADSLHFLSEKGMIQATGREDLSEDQGHCLSCFNGKYPTPTT